MQQKARIRFEWREGLALVCALGRGALDSDPQAKSLSVRGLIHMAACRRAGGAEALERLGRRAKDRLLAEETKATRSALTRLGDLGLVVWGYSDDNDELAYRLTELGWETAVRFGRQLVRDRQAAQAKSVGRQEGVAIAGPA